MRSRAPSGTTCPLQLTLEECRVRGAGPQQSTSRVYLTVGLGIRSSANHGLCGTAVLFS